MKSGQQGPPFPSESESEMRIPTVDADDVEIRDPSLVFLNTPVEVCCPYCRKTMKTRVVYSIGAVTWCACVVLCLMGCLAGCCLIPFCTDGLQDAEHYCSKCSAHIGTHKIM